MDSVKSFIRWVLGVAFIMSGFSMVKYSIPALVFYILTGLMILPELPVENPIDKVKKQMKRPIRIVLGVLFFLLAAVFYQQSGVGIM